MSQNNCKFICTKIFKTVLTLDLLQNCFTDGNPVTGEGYEAAKPVTTPAQHVSAQSEPAPEQKKTSRVPPGGYSSGLW